MPALPTLFINADDFGLTAGVNRAIGELHAAGALPSATLMACGTAFADAIRVTQEHPTLEVGCHVVLVDGTPLAPAGSVPSLVTKAGILRDSLPYFLFDLQRGRIRESDIEAEAIAQIRHLQHAGITVTHVDTHKHTHLFPRVARPLLGAAQACGVSAVRNPFEPAWSARLTRGALVRKLEVTALRSFRAGFQRLTAQYGIATTDGCIGVSATGNLDRETLDTLLANLHMGTWELVCHPGYSDAALDVIATRLRSTREVERTALLQAIPNAPVKLGSFRNLARHQLRPHESRG